MKQLKDLKLGARVHLMGVCGTAMASLAGLLQDLGFVVTGSDSNPYPPMSTQVENLGIQILTPYSSENIEKARPDFVIIGNVISANNPEAVEVARKGISFASLPQAVGEVVIGDRKSIVVAGTHGKTTTTSLMAWTLDQLGFNPGFLIGGIPKNFSKSFCTPTQDWFVIEGDEYDTAYFDKVPKFVHYRPSHVVLTSVEFDHADIYKDLDDVKQAFRKLMKLIPQEGLLLYWAGSENVLDVVKDCTATRKFSYGIGEGDYKATIFKVDGAGQEFSVSFREQHLGKFFLPMSGDYNLLNALSVIALSHQEKWSLSQVNESLLKFLGVKRRQEVLGEPNGVLVIEDFAHHPTAVKETLLGIKNRYKGRRLVAIFEPRSASSRRKVFQADYARAFKAADYVFVAEAFDQSKINEGDRFSSVELVDQLKQDNPNSFVGESVQDIVDQVARIVRPTDVVVIMSNGGFGGIYGLILEAFTKLPHREVSSSQ